MCAIAGFYGFRDDMLIKTISKQLAHRGPDGEGYFIEDKVTLLNRRLAIIDLKGGDQPIYNEDRSIVTVYNGEIYNYRELRKELEKCGHKFKTNADTEVIVHGFEEWGEKCFDRYNGMFAIALYSRKENKLILVRDHFGIKPLYYSLVNGKLIFSSEIKPIFNSGLVNKKPNDRIIYRYLRYRIHDDQKETFFENIYKLPPGELLEIRNSQFEFRKYTNLEEDLLKEVGVGCAVPAGRQDRPVHNKDIARFRRELIKAVTYRLIADVPVGTCLSGGLDSSTIVSIVNKLLNQHVKESRSVGRKQNSVSAVFPGLSNDEEIYINEVLKSKSLKSFKVKPTPEQFFEEIQDFIRTQEEPTISTGPYAQYKVMEEAKKHVKVLLDGQGSDEMMAGYLPYYFVYWKQLVRERRHWRLVKELVFSADIWMNFLKNKFKKPVAVTSLLSDTFAERYAKEAFVMVNDNLKIRLVEDIFHNSLPSLLRYEDRNSMRFSIEGRVPFLDFNLAKFIFSLSDEAIINDGWNKFILRQATTDLLPPFINRRRNKIGFTTPEYDWFMRMKNRIYHLFLSESFAKRKYFNQPEVLKAFQQFIEGKNDDTMVFWRLMNVEMWLREFFDSKPITNDGLRIKKFNKIITVDGKRYERLPIKTDLFKKNDDYVKKIADYSFQCIKTLKSNRKWFVVVSEKVVAIAQGRSYFIWDIKPSFWAKILSKYVTRTPAGIGLGSPWTMQLAVNEDGLARILFASIVSFVSKPLGIKGLFYRLVSGSVASIDGPTEYSLYPSNVSAKLGPKEPQRATEKIHKEISNFKFQISNFLGVVIIDANDIGQKVLGNSTPLSSGLVEKIFRDNPMGQSNEQTPLVMVQLKDEKE